MTTINAELAGIAANAFLCVFGGFWVECGQEQR